MFTDGFCNLIARAIPPINPPPEVEARVDQFLEAIVSAEEPFQWQQTLSIGFKRTTNGNSGINAVFIAIGDFFTDPTQWCYLLGLLPCTYYSFRAP